MARVAVDAASDQGGRQWVAMAGSEGPQLGRVGSHVQIILLYS